MDFVGDLEHALDLVGIASVDEVTRVQTAAANMTVGGDRDAIASADVLDRAQRLRDSSDGDTQVLAAIGAIRAGPERAHRRANYRPRLPQGVDAGRLVGPLAALGEWADDLAD